MTQRTDQRPGVSPTHRLILTAGNDISFTRMTERFMVDVLANVVFIQPDGPIRCNGKILRVDQIVFDRIRSAIFELDLPTPGRAILSEDQPQLVAKPFELSLCIR